MIACILSVGNELLRGNTVDTNSGWLAARLLNLDIPTGSFCCLPDDRALIARKLKQLANEFDIIVVTGGLGPTNDDITRDAAAEAFWAKLELKAQLVDKMRMYFADKGVDMPARNLRQAMIPKGALILPNPLGTACGFWFPRGEKAVFFLPGVPGEMKAMFDSHVVPNLQSLDRGSRDERVISTRKVCVYGIGESALEDILTDLSDPDGNPALGFSCAPGLITVHLSAHAIDRDTADELLDTLEKEVRNRVAHNIVGKAGETPVSALSRELRAGGSSLVIVDMASSGQIVVALSRELGQEWQKHVVNAEIRPWKGAEDLSEMETCLTRSIEASSADMGMLLVYEPSWEDGLLLFIIKGQVHSKRVRGLSKKYGPDRYIVELAVAEFVKTLACS